MDGMNARTRRWSLPGTLLLLAAHAACGDDERAQDTGDGAAAGDDDGNSVVGTPCAGAEARTGEGTYYDFADGSGNCGFPPSPDDLMVAAMNAVDYAGSAVCGSCVRIQGPDGSVDVRIVDQCPECPAGDIDLSPEAFALIAPLESGRVSISWEPISCAVDGPLVYHFKDGSNPWWTAVQIRNHRQAIATFEVLEGNAWVQVPRVDYNYFVDDDGMGEGPLSFRVTDVLGNVVEDSGIPLLDDADASGQDQFPACDG
jgi:expansin (peptidoglycan-binding protein)